MTPPPPCCAHAAPLSITLEPPVERFDVMFRYEPLAFAELFAPEDVDAMIMRVHDLLERFTTCFDRAAARHARRDTDEHGRWLRAYMAVSFADELGMDRQSVAQLAAAALWARSFAPEALEPLRAWHADWEALLGPEALHTPELCGAGLRRLIDALRSSGARGAA